ncbi:MAG TPA: cupin domain-containing protein [Solirubrobacterales bacterium]|jgi:mannose-6-phosphate isomerase-like protein (cupin superfamily)
MENEMADYAVKTIDDMEAVYGGAFKRARAELGVESFGLQVLDFPPNADAYPEHDHAEDGQEEVYVILSGSGEVEIDGERHPLGVGTMARVSPGTTRKLRTGAEPMRVLAIGGCPGKVYEAPEISQLGVPDPLAQPQG